MDDSQDHIKWLDRPQTTRGIIYGLIVVDVILVVVGELIHKHGHFDAEYTVPAFYAIFGFFAYCSIIAGAVMLRKVVKRREDYYDE